MRPSASGTKPWSPAHGHGVARPCCFAEEKTAAAAAAAAACVVGSEEGGGVLRL